MRLLFFLLLLPFFGVSQTNPEMLPFQRQLEETIRPDEPVQYALSTFGETFHLLQVQSLQAPVQLRVLSTKGEVVHRETIRPDGPRWVRIDTYIEKPMLTLTAEEETTLHLRLLRQEPRAQAPAARVDQIMAAYTESGEPGAAVAIVQGDTAVLSKGYGLANIEHDIPMTPQTISDIGSVAKQFTAFAIALLAEEGKLDLDADIRTWFPESPDFGITVRQMVHHISGLREIYTAKSIAGNPREGISQFEAQELLRYAEELNFPAGSQYAYCNTAYMLLADIVAEVSGMRFEDFMRKRIFEPLGMHDTYIMDVQGETFPNRADSYTYTPQGTFRQVYDVSSAYGQGGMYTTMDDLVKWLHNLSQGTVGGPEVLQQIRQRGVLTNGDTLDYAFGLVIDEWQGLQRISHTGSSAGYRAYLAWYPTKELGVLIKANRADINVTRTGALLADAYLQVIPREPEANEERPEQSAPEIEPMTAAERNARLGAYYSPELDVWYEVVEHEGQLALKKRIRGVMPLTQKADGAFASRLGAIRFIRADNGAIAGFRLDAGRVLNLRFDKKEEPE